MAMQTRRSGSGFASLTALAAFAAGWTLSLLAQGQPPLRVETVFVQADAYVSDERGAPLTGLSVEDFEIYEDGVRQKIEAFRFVRIPLPGEVAAGQAPAERTAGVTGEGRTYVFVLDDLHVTAAHAPRVRSMLIEFLDQAMGPEDRAAVLHSSGPAVEFTDDRAALRAAAERFTGKKLRPATSEKLDDPRLNRSGRVPANADPFEVERSHRAQTTFDLLTSLGQRLRSADGRRITIVFVSEGVEIDEPGRLTRGRGASAGSATRDLNRALGALSRGNAVVYTIDPRGNATGSEALIETSSIFETQGLGVGGARREAGRAQDLLRPLAANTGGASFIWRPDMRVDIARVVRESSQYYLLGYAAPPLPSRAEFRRVEVRVKAPGARVSSRSGYLASR
jgi:VWFA-related protein